MKLLLELFFSLLFFGLFIAFLPTIIGIISLCVIVVFIFSLLKNFFSGDEETVDGSDQPVNYIKVDIEKERENKEGEQGTVERKEENKERYTGCRNYRKTYRDYDDYDYYDNRYDNDMPPEEGDGFRGTGAPFL